MAKNQNAKHSSKQVSKQQFGQSTTGDNFAAEFATESTGSFGAGAAANRSAGSSYDAEFGASDFGAADNGAASKAPNGRASKP